MGACVLVVTRPAGVAIDTKPGKWVTGIDCAGITIIAAGGGARSTDTVDAPVANGAQAAIVTRYEEVLDETACQLVAAVGSTGVAIVAGDLETGAVSVLALVAVGAEVTITAGGEVGRVETTSGRVAKVICTGVVVITDDANAFALASTAEVKCGAGIAIFATALDDSMNTAVESGAGICGAGLAIVT